MLGYSICKINLGLSVVARREDGYNDIESVMYPVVGWCDMVEVVRAEKFEFSGSGIKVDCGAEDNICVKALRLVERECGIDGMVKIHLHKNIPFGAGLGAGSANGVEVLKLIDRLYDLGLGDDRLRDLAGMLGSDTAFFVSCEPMVARGRGELLTPVGVDIAGKYLLIVKPDVGVSTRRAYNMVSPYMPKVLPSEAIRAPIKEWKHMLVNDFEEPIFDQLPQLASIKQRMYDGGAIYSSMSGSGSSIYGIFEAKPELEFEEISHLELIK